MDNFDFLAGLAESIFKLDVAAGIGRGDDARAGRAQMSELALLEPRRGLRLGDVIDARAAAAPGRLGALAQFDAGDRPQNFPRLGGNFLPVTKMAGLVIRCDLRRGARGERRGASAEAGEPAFSPLVPPLSPLIPARIEPCPRCAVSVRG